MKHLCKTRDPSNLMGPFLSQRFWKVSWGTWGWIASKIEQKHKRDQYISHNLTNLLHGSKEVFGPQRIPNTERQEVVGWLLQGVNLTYFIGETKTVATCALLELPQHLSIRKVPDHNPSIYLSGKFRGPNWREPNSQGRSTKLTRSIAMGRGSSKRQEWTSRCCGMSHSTTVACPVGAAPPTTAQPAKSVRKPREIRKNPTEGRSKKRSFQDDSKYTPVN